VLHGKQDCEDHCLEAFEGLLEKTQFAVLDYVHYQFEETLSEFKESRRVVLYHPKCALAERLHNFGQEIRHQLADVFHNDYK
jgi:hypothetical protein